MIEEIDMSEINYSVALLMVEDAGTQSTKDAYLSSLGSSNLAGIHREILTNFTHEDILPMPFKP